MTRKTSRRFANYSKQNENKNQQFNEQPQLNSFNNSIRDNDSTIADMAQGFIQAQAKISDKGSNVNNSEIALLLRNCNDQLAELRRSTQGNVNNVTAGEQNNKKPPTTQETSQQKWATVQGEQQQASEVPAQDLQGLLASLLEGKNANENKVVNPSTVSNNSQGSGENQQNMMTVQNASQVLAQAQYELANELENSLKKLKQVISESEKIAKNISNLLGEEAPKKT